MPFLVGGGGGGVGQLCKKGLQKMLTKVITISNLHLDNNRLTVKSMTTVRKKTNIHKNKQYFVHACGPERCSWLRIGLRAEGPPV